MEGPEQIKFQSVAEEMMAMVERDQTARIKHLKGEGPADYSIDIENTKRMKEIVKEIGWPTISKVGGAGSENAWLLVQHADHDVDFQELCLNLMKQEPPGEVSPHDIAYLEDRTRINRGKYQVYGTQYTETGGKFVPRPIENREAVDERRKVMGLSSLEDGTKEMYEKYKV